MRVNKETWIDTIAMDSVLRRSIPLVFPIIEPRCELATNFSITTDTAGCLVASWDSMPYQSQWVVAYSLEGQSPQFDTVDTCFWQRCDLEPDQIYSVSLRSRCTNLRTFSWSRWSSPVVGIAETAAADRQVRISPNPASGRVQVTASCGMTEVTVYNPTGEQVLRQPASGHNATLDTGRWPAGVYVVHVETPLGRAVKKLIIQ